MKLPQLRNKKRQGFTLIELLTVIAIIGILAGMLSVVVPLVKKKAAQLDSGNNCKQIATAYAMLSSDGANPRNISVENAGTMGGGVTGWAAYLAVKTGINSPDIWFIKGDPRLDAVSTYPRVIVDNSNPSKPIVDPTFSSTSPKSWAVVANASKSPQNPSNYPVVWTRGLQGTSWDKESPWRGEGGHVGFLDGHQVWMKNTDGDDDKGAFLNVTTQKPTNAIQDAIGQNGKILEDK